MAPDLYAVMQIVTSASSEDMIVGDWREGLTLLESNGSDTSL
jgi:hypothetical protein